MRRGKITAALGLQLLETMAAALKNCKSIVLPLFVLNGGHDLIVNSDDGKILYQQVQSEVKVHRSYEGRYHGIFKEPNYLEILEDIDNWLSNL